MSLIEMQTALAMIVKYPGGFVGEDLEALLDEYDLTDSERRALGELAGNRELGKFGFGIQDMRWELLSNRLPLVQKAVSSELLFEIFVDSFDPQAADIQNIDLVLAFIEFLQTDASAGERLRAAAADWLWDALEFEKMQLEIERDRWNGLEEPENDSRLLTHAFYLRELAFDLPTYIESLSRGEPQLAPARQHTYVLLIGTETLPGYRLFALDTNTYSFLKESLEGKRPAALPDAYPQLVAVGLCRMEENRAQAI